MSSIKVLDKSNGLENSEAIVWQLAIALFVAWIIVFLCIFKGIKSSGKVEKLFIFNLFKIQSFKIK
jgi:hypothetical protein